MPQIMMIPSQKGTYVLVFHALQPGQILAGRLGRLDVWPGWYLYVGSAFGPGGLRGRMAHHLDPARPQRWHVDALKGSARLEEIWYSCDVRRVEHDWALICQGLPGIQAPWPRFGASDCRCPAHLFYSSVATEFVSFVEAVSSRIPGCTPISAAT